MNDEDLVQAARAGNRLALEELISRVQTPLYNLALRMLWLPADAEDATQDILIKIITNLAEFRAESRFRTWTWRIALNHLLTLRKRAAEQRVITFTDFAIDLEQGLSDAAFAVPGALDERLLVEEAKVGCMQAMLLCLSREERAVYVLGEVIGVVDREGAEIFEISAAAYRKRLSRARDAIRSFMHSHCGLANPDNPCHCRRRVRHAMDTKRLDPDKLLFARNGEDPAVLAGIAQMDALQRAAELFRTHPIQPAPETIVRTIRALLSSGKLSFL